MSSLARVFPPLQRVKLPLNRDQLMLLMAAVNELFLGLDIYLAHNISGTIVPNEWIPIIFGPIAGVLLLLAGLLAIRRRELASLIATVVFVASIVVGLLGAYFHLNRAALPACSDWATAQCQLAGVGSACAGAVDVRRSWHSWHQRGLG